MDHRSTLARRIGRTVTCALALAACGPGLAGKRPPTPKFEFEHGIQTFETTNGMRFALVRDARTNLATIDLRYDVGAASDPPGRSGLAHLVEHVMFEMRTAPGEPTIGDQLHQLALYSNADTTWDSTHYTSTVPAAELEHAIALEAARMAATCDQLDDAVFARERDVVLAEEAERAGPTDELIHQVDTLAYGADHPYARDVGSREIAAATRDEVCAFIEAHYAPASAYLVVTGPFHVEEVREMIGRAFGPMTRTVTAGPPAIARPVFTGDHQRITAPITRPTALVLFAEPAWGSIGALRYQLGGALLARELADADAEEDWIVATGTVVLGGPRAPVLGAIVEVASADRLDSAADEVFARVARLEQYGDFDASPALSDLLLDEMTRWDDLMGRGAWIADYLQYAEHRWFMLEDLREAAEGWPRHRAEVVAAMQPQHAQIVLIEPGAGGGRERVVGLRSAGNHDLVPWRPPVDPAEADQPLPVDRTQPPVAVERYQLANGLEVALAPDPASPLVDARLVFPVGTADQPADQPLLALAGALLLGPPPLPANKVVVGYIRSPVGDAIATDVDVDEMSTVFSIRGLAEASDDFVGFLDGRLRNGVYDGRTLEAVTKAAKDVDRETAATDDARAEAQEKRFRERLFGVGHPYAAAPKAYAPALAELDPSILDDWRTEHYRARGATLVVSGRFAAAAVKAKIADTFGRWNGDLPPPVADVPEAQPPPGPSWLAIEDRRAAQVAVRIGFAAGSHAEADRAARAVLIEMLLDQVRDVREGMGASYGLHAGYIGGLAGSAVVVAGSVEESKVAIAVPRLLAAIDRLRDDEDARKEAFVRARRRVLAVVQAQVAGASTMAARLAGVARRREDAEESGREVGEIAGLRFDELTRIARVDLDRAHLVVELRGRRGAAAAAFAAMTVTPEWLGEEPGDDEGDGGRDGETTAGGAARPAPPHPVLPPARGEVPPEERLAVGSPHNAIGPREPGLYHGDRKISLDAFLRQSGHGDEADDVVLRRRVRYGLVIGGGAAVAATALYLATALESCELDPHNTRPYQDCVDRNVTRRNKALGGVIGGGLAVVFGFNLSSLRPDEKTLRRYADQHNDGLRKPVVSDLTISPAVSAGGLGVVVDGHF